ncbi:MAG: Gfo/Idh/MocA family oxidoreductase [Phycisphaeraceae bacterium]
MTFRWAIIGPGGIGHKFAGALRAMDDAQLHAVVSRDAGRAKAFCQKHDGHKGYDAIEPMLADPEVDAVYIATPHPFHHDQAIACLRAGRPVLCEKPLAVNGREAAAMIAASQETGVFLMEAMWARFLPIYEQVRTWLDDGRIGAAKLVTATFGLPLVGRVDPSHRMVDPQLAGGAILDMGIYPIAVTQHIYQADPVRVSALGQVTDKGVDLYSGATMDYGDGRSAQFMCTMLNAARNEMFIHGQQGTIHLKPAFFGTTQATLHSQHEELTVTRPFRINGFEYQIEEVMACIAAGRIESDRMPHAQTLSNAKVIDTIRQQIGSRYDFE